MFKITPAYKYAPKHHCNATMTPIYHNKLAATVTAIRTVKPSLTPNIPATPRIFSLTTAPGKLHLNSISFGSRFPYANSLAGLFGHANANFAGQLRTMSKHKSSQGNISLYGPSGVTGSMPGLRVLLYPSLSRLVSLNSFETLPLNVEEPSLSGAFIFRGCSQSPGASQSSQRGMRMEQSQFL
jgi:hypothetical protein